MQCVIHHARDLYEALPAALKAPLSSLIRVLPVRVRYGQAFARTRRILDQPLTAEVYQAQISCAIRRMSDAAVAAPRWSRVLVDSGMPTGVGSYQDIGNLPLLSKEDLRDGIHEWRSALIPESAAKWVTTGGTTGSPVGLWIEKDASAIDWAYTTHAWSLVGFKLDERRAVLRGTLFKRGGVRELTHYEPLRRELYLSVFDLDNEHLPEIRAAFERFAPRFIHGYPSAMEVLGRYYRQVGAIPPRLEALLSVSEALYPSQRAELERLFGCRVFSFYGMTEKAIFAAECPYSSELHVDERYGLAEIVDNEGRRIEEPGVYGEVVATGLISRAVPLLRYRTGDWACWAAGECRCGSPMRRFAHVRGRWPGEQNIIGKNGAPITMTALNLHSPAFDRVRRIRFYQETPGHAVLLLEPGSGFSEADVSNILNEIGGKLVGQVELSVRPVDELPLTPRGKHMFIDQRIGGGE